MYLELKNISKSFGEKEVVKEAYEKNNINEKQDVKRYLLYALVLSRIYGTQRVYKTILQFFKKINEED